MWDEEKERAEFESACYRQSQTAKDGVLMFNAAWWGWKNAKMHERGLTQ